jgi:hypothetical protein
VGLEDLLLQDEAARDGGVSGKIKDKPAPGKG